MSSKTNTPATQAPDLTALAGSVWRPRRASQTLLEVRVEEVIWGYPPRLRVSRLRPDSVERIGGWDLSWRHISLARLLTHYRPVSPSGIYGWITSVVGQAPLTATRYDRILAEE